MNQGIVEWFDSKKGYGFIAGAGKKGTKGSQCNTRIAEKKKDD